ncbi:general transcription factor II-I repeat domain-containing protein 2A-like isoform X1 [Centruroides sculpturatus]|uniref:general transcription factor II-I repeat domain-containing protein 2A-like isoform X1 n=1 Tax=Centruroides sculpturatus TaxID=218467 RepID=UPI000C6EB1EC|nr:general transcription factor II-I repeat domain-containing protein 2A-like isoform X1 [Centruroides sculpturatus]
MTIQQRISQIASDISGQLNILVANCAYFSLAVDESTDISSTAQVIVFIRSVSLDFIVNEEFLGMASLSGHTTGADLFTSLLSVCNKSALDFDKLSSIATDGAPSMVGCENGMVTLLKNHLGDRQKELVQYHCIIHQQQLCAKKLGFERLLKDVYDTVNLIRRHGLNHRLFTSFLEEIDADYADLPTYTEVRWLSKATVLKRFVELLGPIITFLKERGNTTRNLEGQRWQCDLAFLADITAYLNDLNLRLQGKMQLVSQLTSNINAFMTKLSLFKSHMQSENFTHFPHCKAMKEKYPHMKMDYSDQVNTLLTSFNERFGEFQKYKIYLQLFSTPFDVKVEDAPPDVQLELIDIQCSDELKSQFKNSNLLTFYKELPDTSFPKLKDNARFCASMFGSTYVCEQAYIGTAKQACKFSLMNLNKCKTRNRLTNENLENLLVISTSAITPDIKKIAASIQISAIALIAWRSGPQSVNLILIWPFFTKGCASLFESTLVLLSLELIMATFLYAALEKRFTANTLYPISKCSAAM